MGNLICTYCFHCLKSNSVISVGDWLTIVTIVILIIALAFNYYQIRNSNRGLYAATIKSIVDILQNENVREARKHVFENLENKTHTDWGVNDSKQAEIVCHSFDSVGLIIKFSKIPESIVVDGWNASLIKSWKILESYMKSKSQEYEQRNYWENFKYLNETAIKYKQTKQI